MAIGKTPSKTDLHERPDNNPALYQGRVYFMQHRNLESSKEHFMVVLNKNPSADERIYVAVITSQIDNQEKWITALKLPEETLVKLSPGDYAELTKPSVISCNSFPSLPKPEFEAKVRCSKECNDLPNAILEKIIAGVKKSPLIIPKIKDLII